MLVHEAQRIVDQVLTQSLLHIRETIADENRTKDDRGRFIELENDQWSGEATVTWPTIGEFNNENVGLEKLHEYIEKVKREFVGKSKST